MCAVDSTTIRGDRLTRTPLPTREGATKRIGRYHLLHRLAAGGMGEVYLARLEGPVGFEKLLVIKRLLAQNVDDFEFHEMFFTEAKLAAQLNHSNVVQTYELGETEQGDYFIAMEFVRGQSMHQTLTRAASLGEPMPPRLVVEAIAPACAGLEYAHTAEALDGRALGVVHRDVSPSN
ncbi:MAG: protein kinase, partial [Myxococcota bacterium]